MLKLLNILLLCCYVHLTICQNTAKNLSATISYEATNLKSLKISGTNYRKPILFNLTLKKSNEVILFKKDSILFPKGLIYLNFDLSSIKYDSTETYNLSLTELPKMLNQSIPIKLNRINTDCEFILSDSIILVNYNSDNQLQALIQARELNKSILLNPKNDTLDFGQLFGKHSIFEDTISITLKEKGKELASKSYLYSFGKIDYLKDNASSALKKESLSKKESKFKKTGDILFENQFYQSSPFHNNASIYPNTFIQATSNLSLYGLPFNFSFSYNSSDAIAPNFQNYFSFNFDTEQLRNNAIKELEKNKKLHQYNIDNIDSLIEKQKESVNKLDRIERLVDQHGIENLNIDSLMSEELVLLESDEKIDSTLKLTQDDSFNDSLKRKAKVDSTSQKVNEIQTLKERFNRSISSKYVIKNNGKEKFNLNSKSISNSDLYQKYTSGKIPKSLLLIEKLQLGNFNPQTGEYSIKDVELIGGNFIINLSPNYELNLLHGKVNDFPFVFSSDIDKTTKRASSIGLKQKFNSNEIHYRLTQFSKKQVNEQIKDSDYKLLSVSTIGELDILPFSYMIEFNNSNMLNEELYLNKKNKTLENSAIFGNISFSFIEQLTFEFDYHRVGSAYKTEGVYFLQRNIERLKFSLKARLFKKQLLLKSTLDFSNRNIEQSEVHNSTRRYYYEASTKLKRFPNIQMIYSPISLELASKLDTSFTQINAKSEMIMCRIFYIKKIKRTFINLALIHLNLKNESTVIPNQTQSQIMSSVKTKNNEYSSNLSFHDHLKQFRFISFSARLKLNEKISSYHQMAYQFQNLSPFPFRINNGLMLYLNKSIQINLINALLLNNSDLNFGGRVGFRFKY